MSLTNLRMKSKAPSQEGHVRGGADANYIPGVGSQPNHRNHGLASGPMRGAPSPRSPLGPGAGNKPLGHSESSRMQRYNEENQRSRERGETVPKDLYGKKKNSAHVMSAVTSANSAPYGRTRPSASSLSHRTCGAVSPSKGAGRARGMNCWYPNKGIAASGDSGESQRSTREE